MEWKNLKATLEEYGEALVAAYQEQIEQTGTNASGKYSDRVKPVPGRLLEICGRGERTRKVSTPGQDRRVDNSKTNRSVS